MDWCTGRLAGFKRPKGIDFELLPRTDSGKIGRGKLRESFLARYAGIVMAGY
jgi:acyl-coenzyme A synthetase/AMP-(fatty) acid ligase